MLATHTCAAGGSRRAPGVVHDRGAEVSTVAEVLPLLYLHGLASSDFPAPEQFLGSAAGHLSRG